MRAFPQQPPEVTSGVLCTPSRLWPGGKDCPSPTKRRSMSMMYADSTESTRSSWTTTRIPFVRRRLAYRRSRVLRFPALQDGRPGCEQRTYRASRSARLDLPVEVWRWRRPRVPPQCAYFRCGCRNGFWTPVPCHWIPKTGSGLLREEQASSDGSIQIGFPAGHEFHQRCCFGSLPMRTTRASGCSYARRCQHGRTARPHPAYPQYQVLGGVCKAPSEDAEISLCLCRLQGGSRNRYTGAFR